MLSRPKKDMKNKTGFYDFLYHVDIVELREEGYNIFITGDNGFTAYGIVYKLRASLKYMLKKYR